MSTECRLDTHRELFREWLELTCRGGRADFQEMNVLCQNALNNLSGAESAARFYKNQLDSAEKWLNVALKKLNMSLGDLTDDESGGEE